MYFEKFLDGSYAASESVSHVDILVSAMEGAEFAADAEIALIEEDGRLCMTVGAEGIGDAMAAVADKAKDIGTKIWKWLVEFMRKVRAFVSQAIVSLRNGAIMNTLKKIVAKAKSKSKNDEWKENAPKPERATKWNVDLKRAINGIWFIAPAAVDKYLSTNDKLFKKLNAAMGKSEAFGGSFDEGKSDDVGEIETIIQEFPKITDEDGKSIGSMMNAPRTAAATANNNGGSGKWMERLDGAIVKAMEIDSNKNNDEIIRGATAAAVALMKKMQNDRVLKIYDALKLLDTEVGLAKKLAADAGKSGAKELKKIKKIQKAVSKAGTAATLYCRRQLAAYKKTTALIVRMFSMAGSMEKDDYNED